MVIKQLLKDDLMKESVIYQEIISIGEARGEARGRQQGEVNLVLRLLKRKFGEIPDNVTSKIQELSVEKLEDLGEALLNFNHLIDLVNWLNQ